MEMGFRMVRNRDSQGRYPDQAVLERFILGRDRLIDSLEAGELDKGAYLEAQYQALVELKAVPRKGGLGSFEEGLFNYQYYNVLAKRERIQSKDEEFRNPEASRKHRNQADRHYALKDRETVKILEWLNYQHVQAYFIETPARYLNGKLIEIVIDTYDRAVFHTADEGIINRLVRAGVFAEGVRPSVIQSYIESDY